LDGLRIGGLEKLSAVDWPGQLVAVVFCQGCAWRCRYCHNPHLIPFGTAPTMGWPEVVAWLGRRRGLLDGVVFSGGEPTHQPGLAAVMRDARDLGFKIGLHTGGPAPEKIGPLLPLLDWVGFDFKAPFSNYAKITGLDHGRRAQASLRLLRAAKVACEIRTTWHPALLSAEDLGTMAETLVDEGCDEWVIQRFRPDGCVDGELGRTALGPLPAFDARHPQFRIKVR
jgi:pyruvate formate lyase activating enzyme